MFRRKFYYTRNGFLNKIYQVNIKVQDMKQYQLFIVPIGNAKITEIIEFHPESPMLKYHQESSNSFCLSNLSSAFYSIGDNRDVTDLVKFIK